MHKYALFDTVPLTGPLKEECACIVQISKNLRLGHGLRRKPSPGSFFATAFAVVFFAAAVSIQL